MKPEDVYWDKPDLADDLRKMGDNLFCGIEHSLRRAMLHSAARRIDIGDAARAEGFRAGAEAMREVAAQHFDVEFQQMFVNAREKVTTQPGVGLGPFLRSFDIPEMKS
jgi:hypothetical protein